MDFKPVEAKPDFVKIEKKLLDWWYKKGIVKKYLHKNDKSRKRFSFLDGPITANNPMGVHHGWGRTLKDLYQRYHNMKGEKQRFQNGFDCQGLWVEVEVEKELGFKNKRDIEKYGIGRFVQKCKKRVRKFAAIQTDQSKRLGYFMDWDNSYFTMSDENNYMIWYFLKKCWENGWLYKGRDSVPWCPRCGTAISQHEMLTEDYKQVTHDSVYFKLKVFDPEVFDREVLDSEARTRRAQTESAQTRRAKSLKLKASFLVWTTTPWTIPANVALCVDPKLDYVEVEQNGERLILAKERTSVLKGKFKIVKKFKGKKLIGLTYKGPFDDLPRVEKSLSNYKHRLVAADPLILPVDASEGTGIVHIATGGGTQDFALGKKEALPVIEVIDEEANYLSGLGKFSGKNAKKHPEVIIDYLKKKEGGEYLYKLEKFSHRYPACWRCKTELVWRVVDEWYIAMDVLSKSKVKSQKSKINEKTLRQRMIGVAKKIKWLPEFGLERELDWLTNMHDWLISKKRYWGLALPIWECSCGKFKVIGSFEELKSQAVAGLKEFEGHTPHRPWIDKIKIRCSCGKLMSRISDVGNPWLDAGIVSFSTLIDPETKKLSYTSDKRHWRDWYPADFITESFPGQFKNWFYSLIAMATVLEDSPPYKRVLGFGTLLGEDGRPMHKSWGNAIEFNEGADQIGVDVMRWLYVSVDPAKNLLFGYKLAQEARRKFHLILWNVYKFFVTFAKLEKVKVPARRWSQPKAGGPLVRAFGGKNEKLLDKWIISRLHQLIKFVTRELDSYNHHQVAKAIEDFVVNDLSTWYIRRSRERVGPNADDKKDKENFYITIYQLLVNSAKLLAPFNPFIAEEIFKNLTGQKSVHLIDWPIYDDKKIDKELEKEMEIVRRVCELGHAKRKKAGIKVRQPLSKLKAQSSKLKAGGELEELIKDELNVKEVEIIKGKGKLEVEFDTKITPRLKAEGEARDLIRKIQIERKKLGCRLDEWIEVVLPPWPADFEEEIKRKTLARKLIKGDKLEILQSCHPGALSVAKGDRI